MNFMLRVCFFSVTLLISLNCLKGQFSLQSYTNKDTCYYKVTNTGKDTFLAKRIAMLVFNQKNDLLIEPGSSTLGVEQIKYSGSFYGKSYRFKNKTIQQHPLYDTLFPNSTIKLVKIVNTGNSADTIMGAAMVFYVAKPGGPIEKYPLYPSGSASCSFKSLFLNAGTNNSGIGYESFSSIQTDASDCLGGVIVKCFDGNTGVQIGVNNVIPACSGGRQHTFYGAPNDVSLYHSFLLDDTSSAKEFDSLVDELNNGDFIALYTTGPFRLNELTQAKNVTTLNKIGLWDPMLDTTHGYTLLVGRKSLNPGKGKIAWCQSSHLNCKTNLEYTLSLGSNSAEMYDYPECYESLYQTLSKFTNSNVKGVNSASQLLAFPNPSNDYWVIKTSVVPVIFDQQGKQQIVDTEHAGKTEIRINALTLSPGIYFAVLPDNSVIKLIKN